jgi:exonuclease SbcC
VRTELEVARSEHASHLLAASLVVGEPCPVCSQNVSGLPERLPPPGLDELIEEEAKLTTTLESLRGEVDAARTEVTRMDANRAGLEERRQSVLADLENAPASDDLVGIAEEITRLAKTLETTREALALREAEEKKARTALEDLADDGRRVAKLLTAAQLRVAALEPPVSESDDVLVQWKELIEWRELTLDRLRGDLTEAEAAVVAAKDAVAAGHKELVDTLERHGVVEPMKPYAVQVATALHEARAVVEEQTKAVSDAAELEEKEKTASSEAAVANALAGHLRANGFEQWLMAGALTDLVSGANALLGQLSGDGYSLHSDESGSFSIVDHGNADEIRSVSTLSGGETFLVSLALALSLAETLAAQGGSGLDAIILDEGFGTLDDESLDTVASVLEELTGRGLMVGVITHVKELAARAPVRYEVRREPGGAEVSLVS